MNVYKKMSKYYLMSTYAEYTTNHFQLYFLTDCAHSFYFYIKAMHVFHNSVTHNVIWTLSITDNYLLLAYSDNYIYITAKGFLRF